MMASAPPWPWGPLHPSMALRVRGSCIVHLLLQVVQGYYSAVTYIDRQVRGLLMSYYAIFSPSPNMQYKRRLAIQYNMPLLS